MQASKICKPKTKTESQSDRLPMVDTRVKLAYLNRKGVIYFKEVLHGRGEQSLVQFSLESSLMVSSLDIVVGKKKVT